MICINWAVTRPTMSKYKNLNALRTQSQNCSQFGLKLATQLHEVGLGSNRFIEENGEFGSYFCTHCPSCMKNYFAVKKST